MKTKITKLLFLGCVFLICGFSNDTETDDQETGIRYRLEDESSNFFDTNQNLIKIKIPVTDKRLDFENVINISSNRFNAILIWVKGKDVGTKCDGIVHHITEDIAIDKVTGLNITNMNRDNKLIVAIFNNKTLTSSDIGGFKDLVSNSSSYEDIVKELNKENDCSRGPYKPRESGGDIINGI